MARPRLTHGIFQLSRDDAGRYAAPGDALEKFSDYREAHRVLDQMRVLAETEKRNPYDLVVLPLGPKGEGLLPLGV